MIEDDSDSSTVECDVESVDSVCDAPQTYFRVYAFHVVCSYFFCIVFQYFFKVKKL